VCQENQSGLLSTQSVAESFLSERNELVTNALSVDVEEY